MYFRNILLAIGVAALLIGAALAVVWVQEGGPARQAAAPPAGRESVLVAAGNLHTGTLLRPDDLAWKALPPEAIPPAATPMQPGADRAYVGAVVRRELAAGEPLVPGAVVMPGARGFLAAVLSPGMRAISIPVDAAASDGGLVQPGDYVDVILAQSVSGASESHSAVSETVLQNVHVVAVDQAFAPGAASTAPVAGGGFGTAESRIPKTVTLEVDEENAKRLLTAAQLGKVSLAIRALAGAYAIPLRTREDTAPIWAADVSAAMRGGGAPRPTGGGPTRVTILRGSKTETP
jgi:pilus assembly protein CpaB